MLFHHFNHLLIIVFAQAITASNSQVHKNNLGFLYMRERMNLRIHTLNLINSTQKWCRYYVYIATYDYMCTLSFCP